MAENRRGKDKRYFFSRGQFILLGCGFTVTAVIIFFLGMLVGQAIEERKIAKPAEPPMKIPVRPALGTQSEPAHFREEMTFYDTLTKSLPPPLRDGDEPKTIGVDMKGKRSAAQAEPPPERKMREKAAVGKKAAAEASPADRPWTVQVNALPDEKTARAWVDRLKDKGYQAYVSEVNHNGKLWYRVRVGRFETREEADKVGAVLRSKENFVKSFATSK